MAALLQVLQVWRNRAVLTEARTLGNLELFSYRVQELENEREQETTQTAA